MGEQLGYLYTVAKNARFSVVSFKAGYDMADVDAFLDRLMTLCNDPGTSDEEIRTQIESAAFRMQRMRKAYDVAQVDFFLELLARHARGEA